MLTLLGGCVTTTTGDKVMTADKDEAARLNRDLALNYIQQGKYEEALRKLGKSLEARPDDSATHRVTGFVYERLGDRDRAEQAYRKAVRYGPEDQAALNQFAVFLCQGGSSKAEALRYFDTALKQPDYQDRYLIFTNAGTCAKDMDLEQAEDYLRQAIALRPQFAVALFQLADVAYLRGNYLQARAFLERCMAVSEPVPDTLWLAHRIEAELGDAQAAERFGSELLTSFPESVQARLLLDQRRESG